MRIAIGGDHAGFDYKTMLIPLMESWGHEVKDFGPYTNDSVDYPDFVHPLANAIQSKEYDLGILICGSANGVAITANKHKDIRAAICWDVPLAELARSHNDANILCIPARFTTEELAKSITKAFLTQAFEGGRHANRVNKINC
jgi:ribose 5-phosphate isomerase B